MYWCWIIYLETGFCNAYLNQKSNFLFNLFSVRCPNSLYFLLSLQFNTIFYPELCLENAILPWTFCGLLTPLFTFSVILEVIIPCLQMTETKIFPPNKHYNAAHFVFNLNSFYQRKLKMQFNVMHFGDITHLFLKHCLLILKNFMLLTMASYILTWLLHSHNHFEVYSL